MLKAKRRSKIESFYHGNAFDQTYTQHNLHGLLSKQQFFTFKLLMAELRPVTGPLLMQKWPLFQSQTIDFFLIRWLCLNKNRLLEIRADADELKNNNIYDKKNGATNFLLLQKDDKKIKDKTTSNSL